MGKRVRRRAREHQAAVDERRVSAAAVLERCSRSDTIGELRRLAAGRREVQVCKPYLILLGSVDRR